VFPALCYVGEKGYVWESGVPAGRRVNKLSRDADCLLEAVFLDVGT